jgi:hypothetical protein
MNIYIEAKSNKVRYVNVLVLVLVIVLVTVTVVRYFSLV